MLISSGMTAVGGVFYAFYYNNLFPAQVFDISRSIELILAPIVGGLGTRLRARRRRVHPDAARRSA